MRAVRQNSLSLLMQLIRLPRKMERYWPRSCGELLGAITLKDGETAEMQGFMERTIIGSCL
jgi:hypothetical protein